MIPSADWVRFEKIKRELKELSSKLQTLKFMLDHADKLPTNVYEECIREYLDKSARYMELKKEFMDYISKFGVSGIERG